MLFSIIIPTCDRLDMLQRALLSLQQQTSENFNVIIVDDNKDFSLDLAMLDVGHLDVSLVRNTGLHGVARARNLGIERATGQWILFLDDDDALCNDYLKVLQTNIETNPTTELFWCGVEVKLNPAIHKKSQKEILFYKENDVFYIGISYGVAVKRSALNLYGHFNSKYIVAEDTELLLRLLDNGIVAKPIKMIGIIKDETHANRLSSGFKIYSERRIYEELFETYHNLLLKHKQQFLVIIGWSVYVHFINRNYRFAIINLRKCFRIAFTVRSSAADNRTSETDGC